MEGLKLEETSGVPFYRQIKDQVIEQIRLGVRSPGDALPSVRELSSRLFVSLITVRRAYRDLEVEGWIVKRQGQGTFVAPQAEAYSQDERRGEAYAQLTKTLEVMYGMGISREELLAWVERWATEQEG